MNTMIKNGDMMSQLSAIPIIINFITGSLCILFGVNTLSKGLEKANSRLMEKSITTFTGTLSSSFATGTILTAIVQSSTAVMVITIGLVNSGIMSLKQAMGIIYGANIGTTITAQIMSFNLSRLSIPIIIVSLALKTIAIKKTAKYLCDTLLGIGVMFLGLFILNWGVPHIKSSPVIYSIFTKYGQNPYISMLVGICSTMLVHSSSATVGITIVLFNSGLISFESSVGLMLGDNIGTCATSQLAAFKASLNARRTAWAHTIYNIIGVVIALLMLPWFSSIVKYITFVIGQGENKLIANSHTLFNILSAVIFLPFTGAYIVFIKRLVKKKT